MRNTRYIIIFCIFYVVIFLLHFQLEPEHKIFLIKSYLLNILMAISAILLLGYGVAKKRSNLYEIYFLTVIIKLGVYVIFFYPNLKLDGIILKEEFFIFFIPYLVGLISEIFLLIRRFR